MAHLANIDGENGEIIKLLFVMWLPNKVSAQLRATPKIDTLDLTAILQISRALMTEIFKSDLIEVGAVARSNTSATTLRCFNCGGPHYRKDCIKAKEIICYACGKRGILHDFVRHEIIALRETKMGHCVRQQWPQS